MTIHHPHDEILLSYAAGNLPETTAILVATHLALCSDCRKMVGHVECVGGTLMHEIAPATMDDGALDAALARLDAGIPQAERPIAHDDGTLPRPLRDHLPRGLEGVQWRTLGKGLRYALLKADEGGRLALLHGMPGTPTPHHGHGGDEFTMVLTGGYADEAGTYARGDVQCADPEIKHRPVVDAGEACLCLILTQGGIRPSNPLLRLIAQFLPF